MDWISSLSRNGYAVAISERIVGSVATGLAGLTLLGPLPQVS